MDIQRLTAVLNAGIPGVSCETDGRVVDPPCVIVPPARVKDALRVLRDDPHEPFDQLMDITAVDYLDRSPRFDIVYILGSTRTAARVIIRTRVADGEHAESVSDLWQSADWGERECFDMFGIRFDGHPNLKRILNPDNFYGYPLRKTFPLRGDRDPAFIDYKQSEPE